MNIKAKNTPHNFTLLGYVDVKPAGSMLVLFKGNATKGEVHIADRQMNTLSAFVLEDYQHKKSRIFAGETVPYIYVLNEEKSISIYNLDGNIARKLKGKYIAAVFDSDANFWCVNRIDNDEFAITVYNKDFQKVTSIHMQDELYKSAIELHNMPEFGGLFMEQLAGQDGCLTLQLLLSGKDIIVEKPFPNNVTMITFNEDRSFYLAVNEDSFQYYTYPGHKLWREYDLYKKTPADEEYYMGYSLFYLTGDCYVINFSDRYWIYNAKEAKIIDELIIDGHEPKPVYEIYPNLHDDKMLITDISAMYARGDIIAIHADAGDAGPKMMLMRKDAIIEALNF